MFSLTEFIFAPAAWIREFRIKEKKNLPGLFLLLLFLVPLAHSVAVSLGRGTGIESFTRGLLAGYWAKVIFFALLNLASSGMAFFIASLASPNGRSADRRDETVLFSTLFLASWFPVSFMPAVMLVACKTGIFGQVLAGLGWTAVLVWIIILQISVVRGIFDLTIARSALVCAAAMLLGLLIDGLFVYLAVLSAAGVG